MKPLFNVGGNGAFAFIMGIISGYPMGAKIACNFRQNNICSKEECESACEECKAGTRGCVSCKKQLAHNIIEFLRPIREKREYYETHPQIVDEILIKGTEKAREKAKETMKVVKESMKLDYFKDFEK